MSNAAMQATWWGVESAPRAKGRQPTLKEKRAYFKHCVQCGGFVMPSVAATMLGISQQRILQLIQDGTFRTHEYFGRRFLEGYQVLDRIENPPLPHRPRKKA